MLYKSIFVIFLCTICLYHLQEISDKDEIHLSDMNHQSQTNHSISNGISIIVACGQKSPIFLKNMLRFFQVNEFKKFLSSGEALPIQLIIAPHLHYSNLNNMELSGSIPKEIGQLTKLEELHELIKL